MFLVIIITVGVILSPLIYDMFLSQDVGVQYHAAQTFLTLVKRLVPAVMAMFILILLHQVLITHRICGPIVNFTNTFKKIAEGDLTRKVFLRQGDYLKKECEKINEMIDALARLLSRISSDHEKLLSVLEEVMARVDDLDTKIKVEEALKIVKHEAQLVTQDLSLVKLEGSTRQEEAPGKTHGNSISA